MKNVYGCLCEQCSFRHSFECERRNLNRLNMWRELDGERWWCQCLNDNRRYFLFSHLKSHYRIFSFNHCRNVNINIYQFEKVLALMGRLTSKTGTIGKRLRIRIIPTLEIFLKPSLWIFHEFLNGKTITNRLLSFWMILQFPLGLRQMLMEWLGFFSSFDFIN